MITIPAGEFSMGDHSDRMSVPHNVYISQFLIEEELVSYSLWEKVVQFAREGGAIITSGKGKGPDHPVHTVTWLDCLRWCNARSTMDGLERVYDLSSPNNPLCDWNANGYRLPTEAEWEKAARGGIFGLRFPHGMQISRPYANYFGQTYFPYDKGPDGFNPAWTSGGMPYTSPVGMLPVNSYALYDMAGNLSQWCWDWYVSNYYLFQSNHDPKGPTTPAPNKARVVRGGNWAGYATIARTAYRGQGTGALHTIGFRCAITSAVTIGVREVAALILKGKVVNG